jgi:hypothetical protein
MDQLDPLSPLSQGCGDTPRGRPFEPGMSGNTNGRPKGSRKASHAGLSDAEQIELDDLDRRFRPIRTTSWKKQSWPFAQHTINYKL